MDSPEDGRKLTVETREERHPARLFREGSHLIVRLKEIQACHGAHVTSRVIPHSQGLHQTDGVDRYSAVLYDAPRLAKSQFTERVHTRGNQHNRLAALDVFHPRYRVGQGIEQVRF